jgi:hypothetical protein
VLHRIAELAATVSAAEARPLTSEANSAPTIDLDGSETPSGRGRRLGDL